MQHDKILAYRRWLENREYSAATIEKYTRTLGRFFRETGAQEPPVKEVVAAWRDSLVQKGYSASGVNAMLAAVNGYLDYWKWNGLRLRPLRLQQSLFRDEEKELTKGEYARLVSAAQQQGEHRLCLVIQTICTTGIRVSELKFITVEAVELGRAEVSNKGKRRTVFLPHNLQRLLQAYLQAKKSPPERCLSPGAESRWTGQMYGGI